MALNKRAQIFSLYAVIFTFFLCGISLAFYVVQQGNVQALVVSPRNVLDMRTELNILELREMELIKSISYDLGGDIKSGEFKTSFRKKFIDGVMENKNISSFLFEDLFVEDVEVREQDKNRNLLEDIIYPESLTTIEDGKFVFGRANIKKKVWLTPKEKGKNFPVDFSFEFGRKYLISEGVSTCPSFSIEKDEGGYTMESSYSFNKGVWGNSDIYLDKEQSEDFDLGFEELVGKIKVSSPVSVEILGAGSSGELYTKTLSGLSDEELDGIFDEVKKIILDNCKADLNIEKI